MMNSYRARRLRWMPQWVLGLVVLFAAGVAQGQTPVDNVTYDGDNISTITVGGFTVDASELVSGTSDDPLLDDLDPTTGNFGNAGDGHTTVFDDAENFPSGGLTDTNGEGNPDIFVFESAGQDEPDIWATYSDGGPQLEGMPLSVIGGIGSGHWGSAGENRGVDGDQEGAALALNISDLLDAGGSPLSGTATIHALHIQDGGDVDLTTVTVHVIPCPITTTHPGGSQVAEAGETTDSFTVELREAPTAEVTVTLDPQTADISLNGEAPNDAITLTFGTGDWNVPQAVTVKANDDAEDEGPENIAIAIDLSSTDSDFDCGSGTSVAVADNDAAVIVVEQSGGSTDVVEGGATDTYSVTLAQGRGPSSDVLVTIDPLDEPNQVTLNGAGEGEMVTLTFTPANWQTAQTVTVTAIDDAEAEASPHTTALTHVVSSGDAGFDGMALAEVEVNIHENDCGAGPFDATDYNQDCMTNLADFAEFAAKFLNCSLVSCL